MMRRSSIRKLNAARLIAAGFGVGYAPVAAGTVASVVALLFGGLLLLCSPVALAAAALLATILGWWAVGAAHIQGDPGWVVIDEFAGQWLTMLALATPTWQGLLGAFVLFRLFDVTKLGPVGWADRQHGRIGIMADDLIAGVIAAALLYGARTLWPALG
jgi:phosphatidylglycerophosphatase A